MSNVAQNLVSCNMF